MPTQAHGRGHSVKHWFKNLFSSGHHHHDDRPATPRPAARPAVPSYTSRPARDPNEMDLPAVRRSAFYGENRKGLPPIFVKGGLNYSALDRMGGDFSAVINQSNTTYRNARAAGESYRSASGNAINSLDIRQTSSDVSKSSKVLRNDVFSGLEESNRRYVKDHFLSKSSSSAKKELKKIESQRAVYHQDTGIVTEPDARDHEEFSDSTMNHLIPLDPKTTKSAKESMQIFFDHLEHNKAAREYLFRMASGLQGAEVFRGDSRASFDYILDDLFLKYNPKCAVNSIPGQDPQKPLRDTPQGKLAAHATSLIRKVSGDVMRNSDRGTGDAMQDYYENNPAYISLRHYFQTRANDVAASFGLGERESNAALERKEQLARMQQQMYQEQQQQQAVPQYQQAAPQYQQAPPQYQQAVPQYQTAPPRYQGYSQQPDYGQDQYYQRPPYYG